MTIKEGYISFRGYKTYYRIVNPEGKKVPLLLVHGGPGSTHNSFEVLDDLAYLDDRPVISYDQIGCGMSSLEDSHPSLWVKETWANEVINLREKLGLKKIHLLGHSWGGMLSIIYLIDYKPEGVLSATLSSTLSSVELWRKETHRLVKYLSDEDQKAIKEAEETQDFSALEFQIANQNYTDMFIFGEDKATLPECIKRKKNPGTESYITAWGKCEFSPSGTLKNYEYTDKLKEIRCPVLLFSGANDESTPLQNKVMFENLTCKKKWYLFENSNHRSYVQEHDKYVEKLISFLNENEVQE